MFIFQIRLFDAELLGDVLRKSILVNYDVESLVTYECVRCIPYALVFASLTP